MSRKQWGHGFHTGALIGRLISILEGETMGMSVEPGKKKSTSSGMNPERILSGLRELLDEKHAHEKYRGPGVPAWGGLTPPSPPPCSPLTTENDDDEEFFTEELVKALARIEVKIDCLTEKIEQLEKALNPPGPSDDARLIAGAIIKASKGEA